MNTYWKRPGVKVGDQLESASALGSSKSFVKSGLVIVRRSSLVSIVNMLAGNSILVIAEALGLHRLGSFIVVSLIGSLLLYKLHSDYTLSEFRRKKGRKACAYYCLRNLSIICLFGAIYSTLSDTVGTVVALAAVILAQAIASQLNMLWLIRLE